MTTLTRQEWILLLLREKPLDRIRLMKALFLVWNRSHRNVEGFFEFIPYMYGPCSFELYRQLDQAQHLRLITQAPHVASRWAPYFLTERGIVNVEKLVGRVDPHTANLISNVVQEVSSLSFHNLLRRVYSEAPDFAVSSVVR